MWPLPPKGLGTEKYVAPPSKGLGTEQYCGSNVASKHARKHEARPPKAEKRVPSKVQMILVLSVCWRKQREQL